MLKRIFHIGIFLISWMAANHVQLPKHQWKITSEMLAWESQRGLQVQYSINTAHTVMLFVYVLLEHNDGIKAILIFFLSLILTNREWCKTINDYIVITCGLKAKVLHIYSNDLDILTKNILDDCSCCQNVSPCSNLFVDKVLPPHHKVSWVEMRIVLW